MVIPKEVANAIVDPKAYADGTRLEEALAWLRREAPLAQIHPDGYPRQLTLNDATLDNP